jgi:hypothetical protein
LKSYDDVEKRLKALGFSDEGIIFFVANFRVFLSNVINVELAKNLTEEEIAGVHQYCKEKNYDDLVEAQSLVNFYETKTGKTMDEFCLSVYEDLLNKLEKERDLMTKILEIVKTKDTGKILEELKGYFETLEKRTTKEFIKQNV